jgi:flagellar assembly protein FliH
MAGKTVFRPGEVIVNDAKLILEAPALVAETVVDPVEEAAAQIADMESYLGPTADELRREAETFKAAWDSEREGMIREAKVEADGIIKVAEAAAFNEVKRKTDQAQISKREAEEEAARIIAAAKAQAADIERAARDAAEAQRKEAENAGRETGKNAGYAEGKAEVDRLVARTRVVLERVQDRRAEILAETEQQVIDLTLLIARKVIKVISENQREVVVANVAESLRKVKGRGTVSIHVNLADLNLTTAHTADFIKSLEGAPSIQVVEDSSVGQGGCVIETDFGEIDGRVSSQLAELEAKILEISPIKSTVQSPTGSGVPAGSGAPASRPAAAG